MSRNEASRLWAITCLFNPAGFRSRIKSFREFRRQFPLPLVAVELAYDEPFELQEGDADVLIQIRGGAKLWQKERLLNIAVKHLPDHCDQVVWVDADILIHDPGWPADVSDALEEFPIVHPHSLVHLLDQQGGRILTKMSTVAAWQQTNLPPRWQVKDRPPALFPLSNGYVWAARREILERHGLYDAHIVGGGDTVFICAVAGCAEDVIRFHSMGEGQAMRFRRWAGGIYGSVQGRIGLLPTDIHHMWHGTMVNRRYLLRHAGLSEVGFDPHRDIEIGPNGAWAWASDRPELHDYVRNYFELRHEDEVLAEPEVAIL